jgi:hypothetical protein
MSITVIYHGMSLTVLYVIGDKIFLVVAVFGRLQTTQCFIDDLHRVYMYIFHGRIFNTYQTPLKKKRERMCPYDTNVPPSRTERVVKS